MIYGVFGYYRGIGMNKLSKFNIIGEDIEREVGTFKDSDEFVLVNDFMI